MFGKDELFENMAETLLKDEVMLLSVMKTASYDLLDRISVESERVKKNKSEISKLLVDCYEKELEMVYKVIKMLEELKGN